MWETSGHWGWYRENMFAAQSAGDEAEDERWFALKPMNCPGHVQIFKHGLKSYRDLPLRLAEFGMVHRYEPSGALHGLMRVRGFTQDDAHIFCTEEQLADECLKINDLILSTYADFGFDGDRQVKLSTRPEKRVGTDAMWDHAEARDERRAGDRSQAQSGGNASRPRSIRARAPSTGRSSNMCCATPSAATGSAARRRSTSTCRSASARSTSTPTAAKKTPVMVHRAICGSMERFLGILIEHYAGHFPLWLAPVQVVVATITSEADDYAKRGRGSWRGARACASRSTCATRRSTTRSASTRWRRSRRCWWSASRRPRRIRSRSAGSAATARTVMPTEEALAALVDEATPPDVKRARAAA